MKISHCATTVCGWLTRWRQSPEAEGSSPCSQQPATGPYPDPAESTLQPPQPIYKIYSELFHLRLGLTSGLFPSGFPTITLYTFLAPLTRDTCLAHLIAIDLIYLMIFGDEQKLRSSSLYNFLHYKYIA
jgi:hypothetical protein